MAAATAAESSGLPQFDLAPLTSELFWTVASFLALLWLFQQFVLPVIRKVLDERIERINADLHDAEQVKRECEVLRAQYASQLEGLHMEAEKIRREAERRAEAYHAQVIREMEIELQKKKHTLREEIEFAKRQALKEIQGEASDMALLTAEKLIGRHVEGEDMSRLLDQSVEELQARSRKTKH